MNDSRKLYESRKFQEAALALDEGHEACRLSSRCWPTISRFAITNSANATRPSNIWERPRQAQQIQSKSRSSCRCLHSLPPERTDFRVNDTEKDRIDSGEPSLAESIGMEASLEDEAGAEEAVCGSRHSSSERTRHPAGEPAPLKDEPPASPHSNTSAGHRSSLCNALGELKGTLATSPSATFNLANCAETNGRTAEAVRLLEKYLEMAPKALDADEVHARIADLKSLLTLPGQNGVEVRRLYASAYGSLAERKYDRALADFNKAGELAPEFPLTKWKLALLYEAMGNIDRGAREFHRLPAVDVRTELPKTRPVCTSPPWTRSAPSMTRK